MKQSTAEDLGSVPGIAGARPVGTYDVDAYARGAHQMAAAGRRFGEDISRLGEAEAELAARRARAEFSAAHAQATSGLMGLRTQRVGDPDYKTLKQRWMDAAAKVVDRPAETISDEQTRLLYYDSLHAPLKQEARNVSQQAFHSAADAHAGYRERQLQHLEGNLSTDPEDTLSAAAIDSLHSSIDDAVDKRFLAPDEALAEKKRAALRIAEAHYKKLATEDPARAIDELTAEESPHPLVKHFAGDTRAALLTLARDNLTAREIDAERNAALAGEAREAAADQAEQSYVHEALAGTPGLAGRVANDDALTSASRGRLFLTLRSGAQSDPVPAATEVVTKQLDDPATLDGVPHATADRASAGTFAPTITSGAPEGQSAPTTPPAQKALQELLEKLRANEVGVLAGTYVRKSPKENEFGYEVILRVQFVRSAVEDKVITLRRDDMDDEIPF
jgi:hypothetical protein